MLGNICARYGTVRIYLAFHLVFWTAFAVIIQNGGPLHGDMLEAYFWGQNPQFGYYKHPPFWALVTTAWFAVFPVTNWAFLHLCSLNVTIGLGFIWLILGRFGSARRRNLAFLLILLTPFYSFSAFQFNANTIFYSLWPATLYFFLRSIEDDSRLADWLFGLFGAMMLLSKYTAIFLLLTCFFVSLLHPRRADYYRSRGPWTTIGIIAVFCLPHLYWLVQHDFAPITYVESKIRNSLSYVLDKAFEFMIGLVLQNLVVIALVIAGLVLETRRTHRNFVSRALDNYRRSVPTLLQILAFLPATLFFIGGILASIKLSVNLTNAFLFLVPLTLTYCLDETAVERLAPIASKAVMLVYATSFAFAPVASIVMFGLMQHPVNEPLVELSEAAQVAWTKTVSAPFKIVTSTDGSSAAVSFYAKDHPRQWTDMSDEKSPWITREAICRDGVMSICASGSESCLALARALAPDKAKPVDLTVRRNFFGMQGPERSYVATIIPPQSCLP